MKYRIWTGYMMEPWEHVQAIAPAHFEKEWKVLMFTGLLDKNGREIYEGDKLAHPSMQNPMVVVWHERTAGFGLNAAGWAYTHFFYEAVDPVECEVVGNIHEIPA